VVSGLHHRQHLDFGPNEVCRRLCCRTDDRTNRWVPCSTAACVGDGACTAKARFVPASRHRTWSNTSDGYLCCLGPPDYTSASASRPSRRHPRRRPERNRDPSASRLVVFSRRAVFALPSPRCRRGRALNPRQPRLRLAALARLLRPPSRRSTGRSSSRCRNSSTRRNSPWVWESSLVTRCARAWSSQQIGIGGLVLKLVDATAQAVSTRDPLHRGQGGSRRMSA